MSKRTSKLVGDLVVTVIDLYHMSGRMIPAHTTGQVCGATSPGLLQIDFGPYGIKFVTPPNLAVIARHRDGSSAPLAGHIGDDLIALVAYLADENARLRDALADKHRLAPPRLYSGPNGNGTPGGASRSHNN
jgi:hypothetical protein